MTKTENGVVEPAAFVEEFARIVASVSDVVIPVYNEEADLARRVYRLRARVAAVGRAADFRPLRPGHRQQARPRFGGLRIRPGRGGRPGNQEI